METRNEPALVELLATTYRSMQRDLEERLGEFDLTVDQWRALRALRAASGLTMGQLNENLQTSPASTTRLVDSLVDRALAFRRPSTLDRRQVDAWISDAGTVLLEQADDVARAHEDAVRAKAPGASVDTAIRALSRIQGEA